MTASVPLLISRWHFSNKKIVGAVASKGRIYKLNQAKEKARKIRALQDIQILREPAAYWT
jgi:hypothetical protein